MVELEKIAKEENLIYGICEIEEEKFNRAIVFLMNYDFNKKENNRPYVASGYSHYDYHDILSEKLEKIGKLFDDYFIQVDKGDLNEKKYGVDTGLGIIGKNGLLLNEQMGSNVFIGLLLVKADLEINSEISNNLCVNCDKCVRACPTGAIKKGFTKEKCISFLSQKKEELTEEESKMLKNHIYGCDICIKACPYNKGTNYRDIDFTYDEFLSLSNREFKNKYGNLGFSWRGNRTIKRNVNICMSNMNKSI